MVTMYVTIHVNMLPCYCIKISMNATMPIAQYTILYNINTERLNNLVPESDAQFLDDCLNFDQKATKNSWAFFQTLGK